MSVDMFDDTRPLTANCIVPTCSGQAYTGGYCFTCGTYRPGGKRRHAANDREATLGEFMEGNYNLRMRQGWSDLLSCEDETVTNKDIGK